MRASAKNLNLVFEQEVPSGTINGTNPTFTVLQTPYSQKAFMLFQDGLALIYGVHFTLNVATKTITMLILPVSGQTLNCWYMRKV